MKIVSFVCLSFILVFIFFACSPTYNLSKPNYSVISDSETKVLKGILSRDILEKDTAFGWFKENMQYGRVDPDALVQFKEKRSQFSLLIFCGTWCHDTQNILPKIYRLIDQSGFPADKISLVGMDRAKTALHQLEIKWKIVSVPTFIILKNGKEAGRVIEYGKTGNVEKELADIVAAL
jgi:thiol-disulfide isomerase/thioredoxin